MMQQSHKDLLLLDQKEILNISCEDGGESSLNILLEEVLTADAINNTTVIGDKTDRVSRY